MNDLPKCVAHADIDPAMNLSRRKLFALLGATALTPLVARVAATPPAPRAFMAEMSPNPLWWKSAGFYKNPYEPAVLRALIDGDTGVLEGKIGQVVVAGTSCGKSTHFVSKYFKANEIGEGIAAGFYYTDARVTVADAGEYSGVRYVDTPRST